MGPGGPHKTPVFQTLEEFIHTVREQKHSDRQAGRKTGRQADRQTDRHTHTVRETETETERQRETDRQTHRHTHTHTYTHTDTETVDLLIMTEPYVPVILPVFTEPRRSLLIRHHRLSCLLSFFSSTIVTTQGFRFEIRWFLHENRRFSYENLIGLSFIERPILDDHLKAHKFGFCVFHKKT